MLLVIFAETGLLLGFFLPGDSLLFAAGLRRRRRPPGRAPAARPRARARAAGRDRRGADRLPHRPRRRARPARARRTRGCSSAPTSTKAEEVVERYGAGKAIVLARFIPIVRTFLNPLMGATDMPLRTFSLWNVVGGVLWGVGVTLLGYFLGDIEVIGKNLELFALLIVVISVLPIASSLLRRARSRRGLEAPGSGPAWSGAGGTAPADDVRTSPRAPAALLVGRSRSGGSSSSARSRSVSSPRRAARPRSRGRPASWGRSRAGRRAPGRWRRGSAGRPRCGPRSRRAGPAAAAPGRSAAGGRAAARGSAAPRPGSTSLGPCARTAACCAARARASTRSRGRRSARTASTSAGTRSGGGAARPRPAPTTPRPGAAGARSGCGDDRVDREQRAAAGRAAGSRAVLPDQGGTPSSRAVRVSSRSSSAAGSSRPRSQDTAQPPSSRSEQVGAVEQQLQRPRAAAGRTPAAGRRPAAGSAR